MLADKEIFEKLRSDLETDNYFAALLSRLAALQAAEKRRDLPPDTLDEIFRVTMVELRHLKERYKIVSKEVPEAA